MVKLCVYLAIFVILEDNCLILAKREYKGSSVLRVNIENANQLKTFKDLSKTFGYEIDEWGPTDIFVPNRNLLGVVKARLDQHGLTYKILIDDVGRLINDVDEKNKKYEEHKRQKRALPGPEGNNNSRAAASSLPSYILERYATFKEITDWLHEIKEIAKPIMQMFTLGQTYENNDIYLMKIGKSSNYTKPAIWVDFGVHGREWISISTATYVIYHLLDDYLTNVNETVRLLNMADFYLMPVANPDGYIYSHEEDRMWRKNRVPDYGNSGCNGTDINRNFAYHWGEARASCYQCDTQYRGPFAQSELETQVITASVQALRKTLRAYITVHSYSQMWLTRWGYSQDATDDHEITLSRIAVQAIHETTGMNYTTGSSANMLYRFSGGAGDWAKGSVGIKYAFGVELRDKGDYGFILPIEQLNGTGAEFLAALKAVTSHIIDESKNDSYFNKPKRNRGGDCIELQNILRRKETDTNSHYQLSAASEKSHPETSTMKHNLPSASLAVKINLCTRLLIIWSMMHLLKFTQK